MRLKELRKEKKQTQEEIAQVLNVQKQTYQNYELGKRSADIDTLKNLADYYNVSLDYLVGRSFNNDIGYLTEEQRYCTQNILKLNQMNLMKATSYILGLLATQG